MKQLYSFAAIVLLSFTLTSTFAQGTNYLSIGGNLALPLGSFGDAAGTGFGGSATFEMEFTPNITGVATAGYMKFGGQDFGDFSYDYDAIPIMAGIKYYFMPANPFYAIGQIGFQIFNANASYSGPFSYGFEASGSSTEFAFAVGAGYEIPAGANGAIDITGTFNLISDLNYIGARVAYRFSL
jgi:hypothetical protein